MKQRTVLTLGFSFIALFVALSVFSFLSRGPSLRGTPLRGRTPAPEISMKDHNGADFRMSGERGKVVLILFGFVNCPDECPLTLAHLRQALNLLGASAQDVQVVMVSTDPVRDTPQAMREYLVSFDRSFLGIPGSLEQLQAIWKAYGVEVLDGGETHSSLTYAVDRNGLQRVAFLPDTPPQDIAHDLGILLAEK